MRDEEQSVDRMIEERVQQNENELKLLKFMEASEKYAIKREISRKKAINELAADYDERHKRDYLKKKTGNGGGYITVSSSGSTAKTYNRMFHEVFSKIDKKQQIQYEDDDDFRSSQLSHKYDLEKTIEYCDDMDETYVGRLLANEKISQPKDLSAS